MTLFVFKIILYCAVILFGIIKAKRDDQKWFLLFPIWGGVDLITNIVDRYFISSNLELLVINGVLTMIIFSLFFLNTLNWVRVYVKLSTLFLCIVVFQALIIFNFDFPTMDLKYYSKYGFINILEFANFGLISNFTCAILSVIALVHVLNENLLSKCYLFIIFGLLVKLIGSVLNYSIEAYSIEDYVEHNFFLDVFLPTNMVVSKGLVILGLTWKD